MQADLYTYQSIVVKNIDAIIPGIAHEHVG
jgi:hypothetical protein